MFLELRQEVWVPLSYHGDLREPLMLFLGSQESFRVVGGPLGIPLELVQATRAPSWLEAGNSGFLHKDGVICISEVTDIFPSNLDSSLCFIQPGISHDVLYI